MSVHRPFVVSERAALSNISARGLVDSFVVECNGDEVAQGARSIDFSQILVDNSLGVFKMDLVSSGWVETFVGQPAAVWQIQDSKMLDLSIEEIGFAWGILCKRRLMAFQGKRFPLYSLHDTELNAPEINLSITLNQTTGTLAGLFSQAPAEELIASLFAIAFFWFDTRPE